MAHKILGQRFVARDKPGWHNISKRIYAKDERITATQAMIEVAGDVEVVKCPLDFTLDGVKHDAKACAIVRKPLPDSPKTIVLGITHEAWAASSYVELAGAFDEIATKYPVETAGLLEEGGLAFLCLRAADWAVKGDEMRSYFTGNFSLTPGKGHKVFHSPVRTECWNTNTMGQQQATINLSIPHTSDALQKIQLAANLAAQFQSMQGKAQSIFDSFADMHITRAEAETIFAAAYPNPDVPGKIRMFKNMLTETEAETFKRALTPDLLMGLQTAEEKYQRDCETAARLRETAFERFEAFNPARLQGTVWAAYNAVTEVSDWREGRGADQSLLIGSRAQEKSRAFAAAMELVEAN